MSEEQERKRGTGARFVYDTLRDEILNLTLQPGEPIDEISLADRLSMSRTPIREALVRLAGDGLVTLLPNRSTVVSQIDFPNLHHFFDALTLMYRVTTRLAKPGATPTISSSSRACLTKAGASCGFTTTQLSSPVCRTRIYRNTKRSSPLSWRGMWMHATGWRRNMPTRS